MADRLRFRFRYSIVILQVFLILLSACSGGLPQAAPASTEPPAPSPAPKTRMPQAEVTFNVDLLQPPPSGQQLSLDILDEVTGLALNPERYPMTMESATRYTVRVAFPLGSTVKYRFSREGRPAPVEYTCLGKQVRYRLLQVSGPDQVQGVICAWNDQPAETPTGRLNGKVTDAADGTPLADILIEAGGVSTLTAADGSFLLEGLAPGTHNLFAYSLDGAYQPFQQGAVVAKDSTTPAPIALTPAPLVMVTFHVLPPKNTAPGIPVRLLGNISSLGNQFADLSGGVSTVAYRAPLMKVNPDGSYQLTYKLPAGLDLRYKYSLGDGFWNGELDEQGTFLTRQLIVPQQDVTVEDQITAWQAQGAGPITFTASAPDLTPAADQVSIQFSAFGWTEPIPMWPLGNNKWYYTLYNPTNLITELQYRYCRNDQCSMTKEPLPANNQPAAYLVRPATTAQTIEEKINWNWLPKTQEIELTEPSVKRVGLFVTGVELQPGYQPAWLPHISQALQDVHQVNASWVTLTPSWTYTSANPPVLEPLPGTASSYRDFLEISRMAAENQLHTAIYPQAFYPDTAEKWWQQARKDSDWWDRWFDRYRSFLLNYADLAQQTNASAIILGESGLRSAIDPQYLLADGSETHLPSDSSERWTELIAEIRTRYSGQIIWVIQQRDLKTPLPEFLNSVDQFYILCSGELSQSNEPKAKDLEKRVARILNNEIKPVKERFNKPILLGVGYPSIDGAVKGCLQKGDSCLPFDQVHLIPANRAPATIDLDEQVLIYQAYLKVVSRGDYPWISGMITRGFFPPVSAADASMSVRGKPAEQLLRLWFKVLANLPAS